MGLDPSDVQGFNHDQGGPSRNGGHARNNAADSYEHGGGEEQQKAEALAGWVVQDKRQKGRLDKPPAPHKPHPQPHTPTAAVRIHNVQFPDEEYEQFPDEQFPDEQFPDEQYPPNVEDYGETEAEMQFRLFSEVEQTYPQIPAPQPPFGTSRPAPQPSFPTPALPVQSSPAQPSSHAVNGSNGFHGGVNLGGVDRMTGRQDTPEERAWHSMGEEEQLRFLAAQQDDWNGPAGAPQQGDGWTLLDQAPDNTTSSASGQHQSQRTTAPSTTTAPLTAANLLLAQQQQERTAMGGRPEARPAAQVPVYAPRVVPLQQAQQERGPPVVIQAFPSSHAALVLQQQQLEQLAEQQFQQQQVQQVSLAQAGVLVSSKRFIFST